MPGRRVAAGSRLLRVLVWSAFAHVALARAASAQPPSGQLPNAEYFEGVWQISKVVTAGVPNTSPQPSLAIFTRGYYSIIRVTSSEPRQAAPPARDPSRPTDAEKIARHDEWSPFGASGGTYEVRDGTLVTHAVIAKNVGGMTLTEVATVRIIDRNTFVAAAPPGQPNAGRESTYIRIR